MNFAGGTNDSFEKKKETICRPRVDQNFKQQIEA